MNLHGQRDNCLNLKIPPLRTWKVIATFALLDVEKNNFSWEHSEQTEALGAVKKKQVSEHFF